MHTVNFRNTSCTYRQFLKLIPCTQFLKHNTCRPSISKSHHTQGIDYWITSQTGSRFLTYILYRQSVCETPCYKQSIAETSTSSHSLKYYVPAVNFQDISHTCRQSISDKHCTSSQFFNILHGQSQFLKHSMYWQSVSETHE